MVGSVVGVALITIKLHICISMRIAAKSIPFQF